MNELIDVEALVRAALISIGAGLFVSAVAFLILRWRDAWVKWRTAVLLGLTGLLLLGIVIGYYAWPSLVQVPRLEGMSQAEAEQVITRKGLVPDGRPQYSLAVEEGRVVPHSQSPAPAMRVRPGTIVSFAVGLRRGPAVAISQSGAAIVALLEPKAGQRVRCVRGADNVYRFDVRGTSVGILPEGRGLLVWVRPVDPPSETSGWYLQRPPVNGIGRVESDGSWWGTAQIGNAQWPPSADDTFDLAVTVAERDTIDDLVGQPGVVVRDAPVGSPSSFALGVRVAF